MPKKGFNLFLKWHTFTSLSNSLFHLFSPLLSAFFNQLLKLVSRIAHQVHNTSFYWHEIHGRDGIHGIHGMRYRSWKVQSISYHFLQTMYVPSYCRNKAKFGLNCPFEVPFFCDYSKSTFVPNVMFSNVQTLKKWSKRIGPLM